MTFKQLYLNAIRFFTGCRKVFIAAAFLSISLSLYRSCRLPSGSGSRSLPSGWQVLWHRSSIEKCLEAKCLLEEPFLKQGLSRSDANSALRHIRSYLAVAPGQPPKLPAAFLQNKESATCAVIGGAPLAKRLNFAVQSRLVDETTDVTIRVNIRAPELLVSEGRHTPLGSHTDIMFLQRGSLHTFERYIHGWGEGNSTLGTIRRKAGMRLLRNRHLLLIFRSGCPSRFESCSMGWETLLKSSLLDRSAIQVLDLGIEVLTGQLLETVAGIREFRIGIDVPSTGMIAIIAALHMCAKVHAFAFNGSISGDVDLPGNIVWHGHKLKAERKLLNWLQSCSRPQFSRLCGKLVIFS